MKYFRASASLLSCVLSAIVASSAARADVAVVTQPAAPVKYNVQGFEDEALDGAHAPWTSQDSGYRNDEYPHRFGPGHYRPALRSGPCEGHCRHVGFLNEGLGEKVFVELGDICVVDRERWPEWQRQFRDALQTRWIQGGHDQGECCMCFYLAPGYIEGFRREYICNSNPRPAASFGRVGLEMASMMGVGRQFDIKEVAAYRAVKDIVEHERLPFPDPKSKECCLYVWLQKWDAPYQVDW